MGAAPEPEQFFAAISARDEEAVRRWLADDPALARSRNAAGISDVLWACYNRQPEPRWYPEPSIHSW